MEGKEVPCVCYINSQTNKLWYRIEIEQKTTSPDNFKVSVPDNTRLTQRDIIKGMLREDPSNSKGFCKRKRYCEYIKHCEIEIDTIKKEIKILQITLTKKEHMLSHKE